MTMLATTLVGLFVAVGMVFAQAGTWERIDCSSCGSLIFYDVDFANQDTGFIAASPFAFRTIDGGRTWERIEHPELTRARASAVSFPIGRIGYAAGNAILKTTDAGQTWRSIHTVLSNDGKSPAQVRDMQFYNAQVGLAVGYDNVARATVDGGQNWDNVATNTPQLTSVRMIDTNEVYVGAWGAATFGMYGDLLALKWNRLNQRVLIPEPMRGSVSLIVLSIEIQSGCCRWVGGHRIPQPHGTSPFNKHLVFTLDSNETWHQPITELPSNITAIAFADTLHGFVGDDRGDIYRTADGGFTWTMDYKGSSEQPINDITIKGNTTIAIGDYALILRRTVPVSVGVSSVQHQLTISPNPTSGRLRIQMSEDEVATNPQFTIVDMLGQSVYAGTITSDDSIINLEHLAPGSYLVKVYKASEMWTSKVSIHR